MNILLAVLQGALWLAVRLGLLLLGLLAVVLVLALVILLCPFCADLSWEEDPDDPEGWGKVKIRAGALGLTFPVFTWPAPPPAAAGQEEAKPGFLARLWGRLKGKLQARKARKAARKPPKQPAASQPKQKAKLTLHRLNTMLEGAGMLTRAAFGALRVTHIRVFMPVTGEDPAQAAVAYGRANAWLYPALGALSHWIYMDFEELRLVPCIDPEAPRPLGRVSFRVSARALFVAIVAGKVLLLFEREKVLDVFL